MEAVRPAELPYAEHVDTNCFIFMPGSYHLIHRWCIMPQQLSSIGDNVFYHMLKGSNLTLAITSKPTVNYLCMFRHVYEQFGEEPPIGCKGPNTQIDIHAFLRSVPLERRPILQRLTGLQLFE